MQNIKFSTTEAESVAIIASVDFIRKNKEVSGYEAYISSKKLFSTVQNVRVSSCLVVIILKLFNDFVFK